MQGGAGTSQKKINRDAFSQSNRNLKFKDELDFKLGNALFSKLWVSSPSSTHALDGLGPLFNARACQSCHLKDGRGHPPEGDADATSMLIRLARPPLTDVERTALDNYTAMNFPDPVYGGQTQDLGVPGLKGEGKIRITYEEIAVQMNDETASLRKPSYKIENLNYGALADGITLSPRIANPMIGLGLIDAIAVEDIIANADPDDENEDGISGKAAMVRNAEGAIN